jgi:hypothetical protein
MNHCLNCWGSLPTFVVCLQTLVKTLGGVCVTSVLLGLAVGCIAAAGRVLCSLGFRSCAVFGRVRLCLGVRCVAPCARCVDLCDGPWPPASQLACWLCMASSSLRLKKEKYIYSYISKRVRRDSTPPLLECKAACCSVVACNFVCVICCLLYLSWGAVGASILPTAS